MQKLRNRIDPLNTITTKDPLEEKRRGTRIINAKDIVMVHCANTLAHMQDEKRSGPSAIMMGSHTMYGNWWHHSKDPKKRPFYTYSPEKVTKAITELSNMDSVQMADQLLFIARRSVLEYQPAADAAKKKLGEIGLPV
ncbi:hypothetical protein KKE92_02310 [Candidatus Micrarchaeota archaeon]|nr:hypothetical protein [Candidatus Micrarchaeota archaeon]MBU1681875.1 hypothetical protein [Candidatus Micrarchaeota archaeon]